VAVLVPNIRTRFADSSVPTSAASRLRRQRFELFQRLIDALGGPVHILDVGGTEDHWHLMGFDPSPERRVTVLNVDEPMPSLSPHINVVRGDARAMPQFDDGEFDVVYSNSVIEHVGPRPQQEQMAAEIRRVGRNYFVQTPNRGFPIEPHFVFPAFQHLPVAVRTQLFMRLRLGWCDHVPDYAAARAEVESIRLLTRTEFYSLFPGAASWVEMWCGMAKSFVAHTPLDLVR
jgi:hypothetical protein